jgi:invasion protein IalB
MSEQSKGFIAANWFKLFFVALSILIIAIYFSRENDLDNCLETATKNYQSDWAFQCKQAKQEPTCSLPRIVAEGVERDRDRRAEQCFKRYSFKG